MSDTLSYHNRTLKYNAEVRELLAYIVENGGQNAAQLGEKFGWREHKVRAVLTLLERYLLIKKSGIARPITYTAQEHTEVLLDTLLPTKVPEGYVPNYMPTTVKEKRIRSTTHTIKRDPLTAFLVGSATGLAPSLNFTDSTQGV